MNDLEALEAAWNTVSEERPEGWLQAAIDATPYSWSTEQKNHGRDNLAMDLRHKSEDEDEGGRQRQRCFRDTGEGGEAEGTPPTENDREEGDIKVLPVVERPCHDRALPQGQMGVDQYGHVLVV